MARKSIDQVELEHSSSSSEYEPELSEAVPAKAPRGKASRSLYRNKKLAAGVVVVIVAAAGYGVYQQYFISPDEKAQRELKHAVGEVSALMILPQDDEPVLATVTDAATLKQQQAFFVDAVDGDQLLLFPKSMKAVLWSPSRNRIVNVGPIEPTAGADAESMSAAGADADTDADAEVALLPTVEVRNGTDMAGLASETARTVEQAGYSVLTVGDAATVDYTQTVVVSLSEDAADDAQQLANLLGGSVGASLPAQEASTQADILIVLGGA